MTTDPTPTPRSCLTCRWCAPGSPTEPATCAWLRHLLDGREPPPWVAILLVPQHVLVGDGAMGARCRAWLRGRSGEGVA
jgi:hypothetical protein